MAKFQGLLGRLTHAKKATDDLQNLLKDHGELRYEKRQRRPGDVFFYYWNEKVGHVNLIAADAAYKIDSTVNMKNLKQSGVHKVLMENDKYNGLAFRFHDKQTALNAAKLAEGWCEQVGYSDRAFAGSFTSRQIGLAFGTCNFGKGAAGRLQKYRSRTDLTPKNVTCPEMVILAYQLSLADEKKADFLKLDAKHSSPNTLIRYFMKSSHWKYVGQRSAARDGRSGGFFDDNFDDDTSDDDFVYHGDEPGDDFVHH